MFKLLPLLLSIFLVTVHADAPAAPVPGQPNPQEMVSPPNYEHALGKMILTLLGLILLIVLTVWIMRRLSAGRFGQGSGHAIKILEKRPLSAKSMLYLLEIEGQKVLISESQLEVRPLTGSVETKSD